MAAALSTGADGGDLIRWFDDLGLDDVPAVGGKNASLGELRRALTPRGVRVPNGFATTAGGRVNRCVNVSGGCFALMI